MKKSSIVLTLLLSSFFVSSASAAVCGKSTLIKKLIPSTGDIGVEFDSAVAGCSCASNIGWIDANSSGGKAIYALALSAKMAGKSVAVTVEDNLGNGAPGNDSITYRLWPTCEIKVMEIN